MQLVRRIYRSVVAAIKNHAGPIKTGARAIQKAASATARRGPPQAASRAAERPLIAIVAIVRSRAARLVPGLLGPAEGPPAALRERSPRRRDLKVVAPAALRDLKVAPPPGIEPPLAEVHSQQESDESLRRFHAGLAILIDPLVSGATYASRRPRKWRSHMPMLARAAADCLGAFPRLFQGATLTDHDLRQMERQVQRLGSFLSLVARGHKLLKAAYRSRKQELADRTMEVVDQIEHLAQMPQQPAELVEEIRDALLLVEAVRQPSKAQVRQRRSELAAIRRQSQSRAAGLSAQVRALDLTAKVLRGGSLSAADFPQG